MIFTLGKAHWNLSFGYTCYEYNLFHFNVNWLKNNEDPLGTILPNRLHT